MSTLALVLLNPAAHHRSGLRRWARVSAAVCGRFDAAVLESDREGRWRRSVSDALSLGVRTFIAAGGDGTVGALADAVVAERGAIPLSEITLGAVGLGSSNDFHKPLQRVQAGVPLRIDGAASAPRDLGRARWLDEAGVERARIFVVSASIGVVAAANAFFNDGDRLLRRLKHRWVGGAILYAACRTIARHRNLRVTVRTPGEERQVELTNLSVLKTPYLSGSFVYDTPIEPASGLFAVNIAEELSRPGLLRLLARLARGRFLGQPGTRHRMVPTVEVVADRPVDLELDGEIVRARRVRFDLLGEKVRACA